MEKKWKHHDRWGPKNRTEDNDGSCESGDENLALDDIKKEVNSLTEELKLLVEKKKKIKEELGNIKGKIGEGRRDLEIPKEKILALRDDAVKKRQEMRVLFVQIKNSKQRIQKLRSIAVTKTE